MSEPPPIVWRKAPPETAEHFEHDRMLAALAGQLGTDPVGFWSIPLIEILSRHAARTPDEIAIVGPEERLDWATLMECVHRLGDAIAARVPPGRAVAVLLRDGPEALVGVLACVAAGRVALVLNAGHPSARNATILAHAGAAAVLARDIPAGLALPAGMRVIHPGADEGGRKLPPPLPPNEPAFVVYTSGSTGQPKGIVLSQAISIYRAMTYLLAPDPGAPNRTMSLFALASVTGLHGVLGTLVSGGCAVMPGDAPPIPLMLAEQPTRMIALPALLRTLMLSRDAPRAFASLGMLSVGGDTSTGLDIAEWYSSVPAACRIHGTYGQSESTIAMWFVPRGFGEPGVLPLGFVRPAMEYAVLDQAGRAVVDGEPGVLHVRSRFVALGEWEAGATLVGRMQPDIDDPRLRTLNTGDVAVVRPDGKIAFGGRADRQVKVRGLRIEPAEIEVALRRVPGILDAAIIARPALGDTELLAFVVEAAPGAASRALAHVTATLPPQMWPRRIIALPRLPRLPGGKIDQAAPCALS